MLSGLFVGAAFGFLVQRSQFCFVSGFRILYFQKNTRFLTALFIAVTIQSVGFFTLEHFGLISIPATRLPLLATLAGGLLFGAGMTLANCCASGGWFRSGEGLVGSWIALICFITTMASAQGGALRSWVYSLTKQTSNIDNIYITFNISPWILTALLVLVTVFLVVYQIRHIRYQPPKTSSKPIINHPLFTKNWNIYVTALLIGLLGIMAWYLSAQTGRNYGFGIAVPSANVMQYLVVGQHRYLNWGTYFVLGIMLGSFLSAKLSGEFKIRMPEPEAILQRILGGVIMGIGAALAGGCTVTNTLVSTAYFSWQGWLATLMIMIGCWITSAVVKPTQCRI
ncbi:MAG TPA: YeeE/YedE family protein [Pasteurellaceae bacterium]|nr:YeeE/YedE family protein [Pasteurellaceae bacterium]